MTNSIARQSDDLVRQLPGLVSIPGEDRYLAATRIWAKHPEIKPTAIIHCRTSTDVQAAMRAARERDLPISVRGGGHDWAGRALCNGVVIDLSAMCDVAIAPDRRSAMIGGGACASDVTAVGDPLGLVAAAGSAGCVGMTGLALGGGYGPLIGRCGLALDNIMEAEVVLADGSFVTANAADNQELFWALRGGGGNFGVVTAMRYRLHDLPSVHAGLLVYPFTEAKAVLKNCAALAATMPDEVTVQFVILFGPDGTPMVFVVPCWCGRPEEGEARLAPFLKLGTLLAGEIERQSHGALLSVFDANLINGQRVFGRSCWLPSLSSGSVDTIIAVTNDAPSPGCMIVFHDFKGAASRVPEDATAFGLRRDHVMLEFVASFPDRGNEQDETQHRDWARKSSEAFAGALPGGYPNFLGRDEQDRAAMSYGGNAERLIRAKRRYDPDNVLSSAIPLPLGEHG
jgi:FAD/FMN-containing dehydrogenase